MNTPYQTEILRHQRVIQSPGLLYLPSLTMGMLKWTCDPQSNMYLSYDQKKSQSGSAKNIKLTHLIHYIYNKCNQSLSNQDDLINTYISKMNRFIRKLRMDKMEGSEQCLMEVDYKQVKEKIDTNNSSNQKINRVMDVVQRLIQVRKSFNQQLLEFYQSDSDFYAHEVESHQNKNRLYQYHLLLLKEKTEYNQLLFFIDQVNSMLEQIEDSKVGSVVIAYQPNIGQLGLFLNPMVLSIQYNMWAQISYEEEKKKKQPQPQTESTPVFPYCSTHSSYFQKIVFINLDGEDNFYTLDIFKSLWKYVMYVSFPKNYQNFDDWTFNEAWLSHSELNSQTYFAKQLSREKIREKLRKDVENKMKYTTKITDETERFNYVERKLLDEFNKANQLTEDLRKSLQGKGETQDIKKNLFKFPICSPSLNKADPNLQEHSRRILLHESNFVYRIMMQYVSKIIIEFVPSLVVISYSGKIHLENFHFSEIIKQLAIHSNSRMVFYPSMYKTFLDKQSEDYQLGEEYEDTFRYLIEPFQRYDKHFLNLAKNDDILQKIEIFHTIASGKSNLEKVECIELQVQKLKNLEIKEYSSYLFNKIAESNTFMKRARNKFQDQISLLKLYRKTIGYEKYQNQFPQTHFYNRLIAKLKELILSTMNEETEYEEITDYIKLKYKEEDLPVLLEEFQKLKYVQILEEKVKRVTYLKLRWKHYDTYSPYDHLQPVRFFIRKENTQSQVSLTDKAQVLYHNTTINQVCTTKRVVYVLNHLLDGEKWAHYYALVQPRSHNSNKALSIQQIELTEIVLPLPESSNPFMVYSDWNYCQTTNYCILYWPIKYDFVRDYLSEFQKRSYRPESMLCSDFFIANIGSPGVFTKLQCGYPHPVTRCNSVAYQENGSIEIFIFGAQSYTSQKYTTLQSSIIKVRIQEKEAMVQTCHLKDQSILTYSEYQVYKHKDKVFLFGGYGTQYGSLFQPASAYFYEIDFKKLCFQSSGDTADYNNKKHILKHDLQKISERINDEKKKEKPSEDQNGAMEICHKAINIRNPVKLRDSINSLRVISRDDNTITFSPKPVFCKAIDGYLISNYIHFILQSPTSLYRLCSFQEYYFVDQYYYEPSQQFQGVMRRTASKQNCYPSQQIELAKDNFYLNVKMNNSFSTKGEMDFLFVPSNELMQIRAEKFKQKFQRQHMDLIFDVESICMNHQYALILFQHPRITAGKWVLASHQLSGTGCVNEQSKHLRFNLTSILKDEFSNTNIIDKLKSINLLSNNHIIFNSWNTNTLNIFLITSQNSTDPIHLQQMNDLHHSGIVTHTEGSMVLYVFYTFQSPSTLLLKFFTLYSQDQDSNNYHFQQFDEGQRVNLDIRTNEELKLRIEEVENVNEFLFTEDKKVNIYFTLYNQKESVGFSVTIEGKVLDDHMGDVEEEGRMTVEE